MTDSDIILIGSLIVSILPLLVAKSSLLHQRTSIFPKIKIKLIKNFDPYSDIYRYKYDKETQSLYLFAKFEVENYSPNRGSIYHCRLLKPVKDIDPLNLNQIEQLPLSVQTELNNFNVNSSKIFNKCYISEPYQCNELIFVFKLNSSCIATNKKKFKLVCNNFDIDRHVLRLKFYILGLNFTERINFREMLDSLRTQETKEFFNDIKEDNQRRANAAAVNNLKYSLKRKPLPLFSKLLKMSKKKNNNTYHKR